MAEQNISQRDPYSCNLPRSLSHDSRATGVDKSTRTGNQLQVLITLHCGGADRVHSYAIVIIIRLSYYAVHARQSTTAARFLGINTKHNINCPIVFRIRAYHGSASSSTCYISQQPAKLRIASLIILVRRRSSRQSFYGSGRCGLDLKQGWVHVRFFSSSCDYEYVTTTSTSSCSPQRSPEGAVLREK